MLRLVPTPSFFPDLRSQIDYWLSLFLDSNDASRYSVGAMLECFVTALQHLNLKIKAFIPCSFIFLLFGVSLALFVSFPDIDVLFSSFTVEYRCK